MITSRGERVFRILNYIFLSMIGIVAILPFIHIIAKSLSEGSAVVAGKVGILPVGCNLETYKYIILSTRLPEAFKVSIMVTFIGTLGALVLSVLTAYPLSKAGLKGRKFFIYLYVFDMYFSAGVIPGYILIRNLKLLNSIWCMILPGLLVPFYMFVIKSFYEGLPESLEEAARIDGATNTRILISIIVPLSKPVLATVTLFYAVGYWNSFFSAMMYITKQNLEPLTIFLFKVISQAESPDQMENAQIAKVLNADIIRSAAIIISTVPIIMIYPFLQKYFVKGMTIGSVKG